MFARSDRVDSHLMRPPTLRAESRDLERFDRAGEVVVELAGGALGLELREREAGAADRLQPADLGARLEAGAGGRECLAGALRDLAEVGELLPGRGRVSLAVL